MSHGGDRRGGWRQYTSTGNISSCFFYSGVVNFLMQLQFLAPVELFSMQLQFSFFFEFFLLMQLQFQIFPNYFIYAATGFFFAGINSA